MSNASIHRQQIAQAVVDAYCFQDLIYGERDCVQLCALVLDLFGRDHPLKTAPKYKTAVQAARVLKKVGFNDLAEAVDAAGLERIAPAYALPCDLVAFRADADQVGGWSLGVVVGPNKVLAFIEHDGRHFADTGNLTEAAIFCAAAGLEVVAWRVA